MCVLFVELDPFTDYTVVVAASNQQRGVGAFSTEMGNRTSEGGKEEVVAT